MPRPAVESAVPLPGGRPLLAPWNSPWSQKVLEEGRGNPDLVDGTLIVYDFVRKDYYKGFIERFNKFLKEVQEGKIRMDEPL